MSPSELSSEGLREGDILCPFMTAIPMRFYKLCRRGTLTEAVLMK